MTLTEALSELAIETPGLPDATERAALKMTLDSLACALAGWSAPGMREVVEQMRAWGGAGEAPLLIHGDRLPAPNAAFANSAMIHALDCDDVHPPGTLHIMSVVLPAALAAGEMADATGRDVLAAVAIGVEVAARPAIWAKEQPIRGAAGALLPTSMHGGFGAVAAAARLLGLSVEQTVNAMGINYGQAAGNRQALHDCTLTKRIQPGFAARSALWATALAARGITGPERAMEGPGGLFRTYYECETPTVEELMVARPRWEIERDAIKRHPSCGACHPVLHAAERLREREQLAPEQIERVEIFGHRPDGLVTKPFEIGDDPQVSAQFNVQYCVAYALLRGAHDLGDWTDEGVLADEEVADLARSITFVDTPDDVPEAREWPDFAPGQSTWRGPIVYTTDGRRLIEYECPARIYAPDAVSYTHLRAHET